MTEAEFRALAAQGYNRIPLVLEAFADLDTPLSLYLKLAQQRYTFLLESVVGGERFGRYSFIGLPAKVRLRVQGIARRGRGCRAASSSATTAIRSRSCAPSSAASARRRSRACRASAAASPATSATTPCATSSRKLAGHAPDERRPARRLPDMLLLLTDELAVIDNLAGKIYLIVYADPGEADAYRDAQERLQQLRRKLRTPVEIPSPDRDAKSRARKARSGADAFEAAVRRAKEYIAAGDMMQVVLSQRMQLPFAASPLSLYRALRSLNPSPYMFYYDFGDFQVVGASPEILVRKEGVDRHAAPDRRHAAARRDARRRRAARRASSRAIPKERAEHVMLIDLGRNDVGRVATTGSVRVTEQMAIERYSHVMHIVSNVEGSAAAGARRASTCCAASFPAGTVSGAPKVRAMEIIDELEPSPRGVYAGAVGYISFQDDMDLAIAIRTAVVHDGMLYVQAGAGIVHDSVPETEWQETLNKARAVLRAAEIVQLGLDAELIDADRRIIASPAAGFTRAGNSCRRLMAARGRSPLIRRRHFRIDGAGTRAALSIDHR